MNLEIYVIKRDDGLYYGGGAGNWKKDLTSAKLYKNKRQLGCGLSYVKEQYSQREGGHTVEIVTYNCTEV